MSDTSAPPAGTAASAPPNPNVIVTVLAFAGIVVSLMQTLVIPIVPKLPQLLHAKASDTAWAVTATLLAAAVATPIAGRLGDMYGKRRMLLICLAVLTIGSATVALSDSLTPMIIGRLLQGLSAGVIPLGLSIMRDELPTERLGASTALMSASLGIGAALGLPIAAFVAEHFDWHVLFWASTAMGAAALLAVLTLVPESKVRTGGRFDLIGGVGLAAGLVSMLLAISKGANWGWGSATTLGLFASAVVILVVWGLLELRTTQPLVNLRTAARPQVLFANLAGLAFGFSLFAVQLIIPQILQLPKQTGYGLGADLQTVGLVLAPQGLIVMLAAPLSSKISKAKGPKLTLMMGALIVAAGYALNIFMMSQTWQLVMVACIIGAGIGFAYGALPLLIMGAVPLSETASANAFNTLLRSIGSSIASAASGVILAQMTTNFAGHALPSQSSFKVIMAIGCGAALVALLLASFLPRQREGATAPGAHVEPAATVDAGQHA
jgi:MFS family permease